ncbi:hypothetical protein M8J76_008900 [Diaphorina citri]|nr:hypothetical protein M8J76_008900 [Diaphorina citri]
MGFPVVCVDSHGEEIKPRRKYEYEYNPSHFYDEQGRKRNVCYEPLTGLPIDSHCEVKEPACSLNRAYRNPDGSRVQRKYYRYNYPCQMALDGKECNPPVYSQSDFFPMVVLSNTEYKIRGSKLQRQCECKMRNGLQPDCKRYSHGKRVICACLPLPEILNAAGKTSYEILPVDMRQMQCVKRGPGV